jgi:hypothetical protein
MVQFYISAYNSQYLNIIIFHLRSQVCNLQHRKEVTYNYINKNVTCIASVIYYLLQ